MDFLILLLISFFLGVIIFYWSEKHRKKVLQEALSKNKFDAADAFLQKNGISIIAIDKSKKHLLVGDIVQQKIIDVAHIQSLEVFENENSLVKTNIGSQAGRIAVGGLLAGGVGAVIGGLSASQTGSKFIKELSLKIVIDDFDAPNHKMYFIRKSFGKGFSRNSLEYKQALEQADLWHSRLKNIMEKNLNASE